MKAYFEKLMESRSISGNEKAAVSVFLNKAKNIGCNIERDVLGNGIAYLKGGAKKIMITAHIDELGYMVHHVDEKGFIYFARVGGIDPHVIPGHRVNIIGYKGEVSGVIGRKPTHLIKKNKVDTVSKMWIDCGFKTKEEANEYIRIGDYIEPEGKCEYLYDKLYSGRGLDDKAGVYVVTRALDLLKNKKLNYSVFGVATVQEEIGVRGAQTAAFGIKPDIGIAIDVTFATDHPTVSTDDAPECELGKGGSIGIGPVYSEEVYNGLIKAAEDNKIPYQLDPEWGLPGTDARAIQVSGSGIKTGMVSIPLRYMHTPVEVINIDDLDNIAKLLAKYIENL